MSSVSMSLEDLRCFAMSRVGILSRDRARSLTAIKGLPQSPEPSHFPLQPRTTGHRRNAALAMFSAHNRKTIDTKSDRRL